MKLKGKAISTVVIK